MTSHGFGVRAVGARHVAIVGAGPIGLEAALAALAEGHSFTVYEAARDVAGHVRSWGHVRLFTPWSMNVSPRALAVLAAAGLDVPSGDSCPTGHELVDRLFGPIASLDALAPHIRYGARVLEVGRDGLLKSDEIGTGARAGRPFRMLIQADDGVERVEHANIVLDCSGTYGIPNAVGVGGIHAPGERAVAERIVRRIPNLEVSDVGEHAPVWAGQRILLVGAGHSAQTTARDLARVVERVPSTRVTWVMRGEQPSFGHVADDPLPERARLTRAAHTLASAEGPFEVRLGTVVEAFAASDGGVDVTLRGPGGLETVQADRVVALTGSVGDARIHRQLQVHECWATSGPMRLAAALLSSSSSDCLTEVGHGPETLRNPEPDFFIIGEKSYGRNSNFLMRVGWEQVDDVFALLGANLTTAGTHG